MFRRASKETNFILRSTLILSTALLYLSAFSPFEVWDYVPETLQTAGVAKTSYALLGVSSAISLGLAAV